MASDSPMNPHRINLRSRYARSTWVTLAALGLGSGCGGGDPDDDVTTLPIVVVPGGNGLFTVTV